MDGILGRQITTDSEFWRVRVDSAMAGGPFFSGWEFLLVLDVLGKRSLYDMRFFGSTSRVICFDRCADKD